jgi:hypothetical protein
MAEIECVDAIERDGNSAGIKKKMGIMERR